MWKVMNELNAKRCQRLKWWYFKINQSINIQTRAREGVDNMYRYSSLSPSVMRFQCVVSNTRETAQGTAQLSLGLAQPEFESVFGPKLTQPGPTVVLNCVAHGNPPPLITWMLDGHPIQVSIRGFNLPLRIIVSINKLQLTNLILCGLIYLTEAYVLKGNLILNHIQLEKLIETNLSLRYIFATFPFCGFFFGFCPFCSVLPFWFGFYSFALAIGLFFCSAIFVCSRTRSHRRIGDEPGDVPWDLHAFFMFTRT